MPQFVASAAASAVATALGGAISNATIVVATYAATYVATVAVLAYGASSLAAQKQGGRTEGSLLDIQVDSAAPRQLIVGQRAVAGSMVGRYVYGPSNNHLVEIIALADHKCDGLAAYFANGVSVATELAHGVRTAIPSYRSPGDRLWVTWYDGRWDQNADGYFAAQNLGPNQPDWTPNHRGRGVSYAIVEMWWDDNVMLSPVTSLFDLRGAWLYDRRQDSTAGGSGAHRHADPDTWAYLKTPSVAIDHYNLGIVPYPNASRFSWGVGLKSWQCPYDEFADEANLDDEQVLLKDGETYQSRYEINGVFSAADTHKDIVVKMAKAKGGRIVDRGGRLAVISARARTAVMTLYDTDLVSGEQSRYSDKVSVSELFNTIEGRFQDPVQNYRPVDLPRVYNVDFIAEDGGDELTETVDLECETNEERGQRVLTLHLNDRRRQARLTEAYAPYASEIEEGDWFERVGARFPDGKLFEAIRVEHTYSREKGFFVVITSKECDPNDVAWNRDQASYLSRPEPPVQETEFVPMEPPTFNASMFVLTGVRTKEPAIRVDVLTMDADSRDISIEVREVAPFTRAPVGDILPFFASAVDRVGDDRTPIMLRAGVKGSALYDIRMQTMAGVRRSDWTEWDPVLIATDAGIDGQAVHKAWTAENYSQLWHDATSNYVRGFGWIGALGTINFEANTDGLASIKVNAGYFDHRGIGEKIDLEEQVIQTPWGVADGLFAPKGGRIAVIYSVEDIADRFILGGEGNIFIAVDEDGVWKRYYDDRRRSEIFTPRVDDVVLALAFKPLSDNPTDADRGIGKTDGITFIDDLVTETRLIDSILESLSVDMGVVSADITHLESVIADVDEARATDRTELEAMIGDNSADITTISESLVDLEEALGVVETYIAVDFAEISAHVDVLYSALAAPDGSTALVAFRTTAGGVATGLTVISHDGALDGDDLSLIELDASLVRMTGDVIVDGTLTAEAIVSGSLGGISAGPLGAGAIGTSYAGVGGGSVEVNANDGLLDAFGLLSFGLTGTPSPAIAGSGYDEVLVYALIDVNGGIAVEQLIGSFLHLNGGLVSSHYLTGAVGIAANWGTIDASCTISLKASHTGVSSGGGFFRGGFTPSGPFTAVAEA